MPPETEISSELTLTYKQWELLGGALIFARDNPHLPSADIKRLDAIYISLMKAWHRGIEDRVRNLLAHELPSRKIAEEI